MEVLILNFWYDPGLTTVGEVLARYPSLSGWAEAVAGAGARVRVLQRLDRDAEEVRDGVTYRLVATGGSPRLRPWQVPRRLERLAAACAAEGLARGHPVAVHMNGLLFPVQTRTLRTALPPGCALVAQHHAEQPWRRLRWLVQRWGLRGVDGFFFAAQELAGPWRSRHIIRSTQPVYEIMEGSTRFEPQDRSAARARTGLVGEPAVLWVGRLNRNKDPLAVLDGFEQVLAHRPEARLFMAYTSTDLLPDVRNRLACGPLKEAVALLGAVPHAELMDYYNSADYFVLGSHHEGSGYALAESLACGIVPVVTDIPSFRMMTDGGRIGALWPPGDASACAAALLEVMGRPWASQSAAARRFFTDRLSYPAIGRQALSIYRDLAGRRFSLHRIPR